MALMERIQTDMVAAMKARDEARLNALRMIKAALQKHQVDTMKPLDEAAEQQILKQLVKQRTDAAEMFRKGGRPEQAPFPPHIDARCYEVLAAASFLSCAVRCRFLSLRLRWRPKRALSPLEADMMSKRSRCDGSSSQL